jgi:FixJ family two-component response regulator
MPEPLVSVVDDDASVRRSTALRIEALGFQAAAFESAESFLESYQLHETTCLILDIQLPGMNGLQLQSHLAAAGYKIPIIFITAYDRAEQRRQAMQAGAVAFLGRPFTDELFLRTISEAVGGQPRVRKALISLVDDDASVRRSTALLVEALGFQAAAFESAESFLKSDQLHETTCLILDIQLPGMNGLQLQGHLAAAGYKIPIIFITAYDRTEQRRQAMQAGAVAFLGKPFSDEVLLQTLRTAL